MAFYLHVAIYVSSQSETNFALETTVLHFWFTRISVFLYIIIFFISLIWNIIFSGSRIDEKILDSVVVELMKNIDSAKTGLMKKASIQWEWD